MKTGVYIKLPDELVLKLKLQCVKNKITMQEFVTKLIEANLK